MGSLASNQSAYLEQAGAAGVVRFMLDRSPMTIGRSDESEIVLACESVSRQHARLVASDNDQWRIEDLSSGNGVHVNGERVQSQLLNDGDVIAVGRRTMTFRRGFGEVTRPSLLLRLKTDDPDGRELAWEEFYDRYAPMIAGFARKLGGSPIEADEIVQRVVSGFYSALPRFVYNPAKGRFRGYLKVATLNAVRAWMSQRKMTQITGEMVERVASDDSPAWEEVWRREALNRALAETREAYANNATFAAFERYAILGEEADDVARELGLSVDSVYQAKRRITEALRRKVTEYESQ